MRELTKQEARRALEEEQMGDVKNYTGDKAELFKKREEEIEKARELVIYCPVELSGEVKQKVAKRARELFGEDLFFDFRTDAGLIGGAALAFGGEYRDYSLRAGFEEKREELAAMYREFLRGSS